ncbi:MAG: HIT domain-containing protein [Firmicutes bacterium]|nr:HIT domain-containing protein [Bacillota bacterium]
MEKCLFCELGKFAVAENELAYMIWDKFPKTPGHALIIPKGHSRNFFDATAAEHAAMAELLLIAKQMIDEKHKPDGYNIQSNIEVVAGQEIFHTHLHLIPRYKKGN